MEKFVKLFCSSFLILIMSIGFLKASELPSTIDTIQYRVKKSISKNSRTTLLDIHYQSTSQNIRIEYFPQQRTIIKNKQQVTVIKDKKKQQYEISSAPRFLAQEITCSLFIGENLLNKISHNYIIAEISNENDGYIKYKALPKNSAALSKIEYVYHPEKKIIKNIKKYNIQGSLIEDIRFSNHKKIMNEIVPTKIHTIIMTNNGIIETLEDFSRIRINKPLPAKDFKI